MIGARGRRSCAVARAAAWLLTLIGATPSVGANLLQTPTLLVGRVFELADQRLALMPAVAAAKWMQGTPISDPGREAAVLTAASDRARTLGLAPDPVIALFSLQIRLARDLQSSLHERWRRNGFPPTNEALSMSSELRPRLDRLTQELLEALYLAAPSLTAGDAASAYADLARDRLPALRWSETNRKALLTALAGIRFAGHGSLERARAAGWLRIGTPGDYAPFSAVHDGSLDGVDVQLSLDLARALGLHAVFVQTSWKALLDDLAADDFDVAVGGISVTPARAAVAYFSKATSRSGKTAIGRCADQGRLNTLQAIDQPGVRVIENRGGTNERFAAARLQRASIRLHPDNRTVFRELLAGRADVMFTDETEVALMTHRMPALCRLLDQLYEPADKAMLMPPDAAWRTAVDGWLTQELERGTPARLLQEYLTRPDP